MMALAGARLKTAIWQFTGTLGILGLAARHGLTDFRPAIERLRETNFRASEELIEFVLDEDAKRKGH